MALGFPGLLPWCVAGHAVVAELPMPHPVQVLEGALTSKSWAVGVATQDLCILGRLIPLEEPGRSTIRCFVLLASPFANTSCHPGRCGGLIAAPQPKRQSPLATALCSKASRHPPTKGIRLRQPGLLPPTLPRCVSRPSLIVSHVATSMCHRRRGTLTLQATLALGRFESLKRAARAPAQATECECC